MTVGLVTAWGATAGASTFTSNGSVTVGLTDNVGLYGDGVTITLTPPPPFESFGAELPDIQAGSFSFQTVLDPSLPPPAPGTQDDFTFMGVVTNADGSRDLALAFRGDGSQAIGVAWTSLFVNGLPDEQQVFEPIVLQELAAPSVFDDRNVPKVDSQVYRLDLFFNDLLDIPLGETATVIVFNGPENRGTAIGTIATVPEPAGLAALAGLGLLTARRRRE